MRGHGVRGGMRGHEVRPSFKLSYERSFEEGEVMRKVGGMDVADYQFDGNHTIASRSRHPWRKQFNVLVAYASF